jgi:ABC-2 type transport system permease protein
VTRTLSAELLKLRTTRTTLVLIAVALGLVVAITVAFALAVPADEFVQDGDPVVGLGGFAQTFALVLGVLALTAEFRHRTITPSLLVTPDRTRLVLAKLGAVAILGLLLGLVAYAASDLLVAGLSDARGIDTGTTSSDIVRSIAGGTVAGALYAAVGLGVGAIVRDQVGAIVTVLVWTFVAEAALSAIPTFGDWVSDYGLNGASSALVNPGDDGALTQVTGGLVLLAYAAIAVAVGVAMMRRRDIG